MSAIASASPPASVLGITDYCTLLGYENFLAQLKLGPIPSLAMTFANVELRLTVNTRRGGAINIHLLVSPEDPNHIARAKEALSGLSFMIGRDRFPCSDDGLMRLGRAHTAKPTLDDAAALREGALQFKVEIGALRDVLTDSWARQNILLGVAAGQDGLAGLAKDSGWSWFRKELGSLVDIIFSGQQTEIDYWLGHKATKPAALKPCLHGSDAHVLARVLQPVDDRKCWIRGDSSFESLRQTLAEPERRVFIGPAPPVAAATGEVIEALRVNGAPWLVPTEIRLNEGLVTIIGAKGSGKTALADLIALATGTVERPLGTASFLRRAGEKLGGLSATASWADGSDTEGTPSDVPIPWLGDRVLYLSQQFVERLASPEDLSEPLVDEIERVVFGSIPEQDRLQAPTFASLRSVRLRDTLAERELQLDRLQAETGTWLAENERAEALPGLQEKGLEAERSRKTKESELARARPSGDRAKLKQLDTLTKVLSSLRAAIAASERRAADLRDVRTKTQRLVDVAIRAWQKVQGEHPGLLDAASWESLRPRVDATAIARLDQLIAEEEAKTATLRTVGATPNAGVSPGGLKALEQQRESLIATLGLDAASVRRRTELETLVAAAKLAENAAVTAIASARGAADRRAAADERRLAAYEAIFSSLVDEEAVLHELYRPLDEAVQRDPNLRVLRLAVARSVDLGRWARDGEGLFDLRTGPFQGKGKLEVLAEAALGNAWRKGSPKDVRAAMSEFVKEHLSVKHLDLAHEVSRRDVEEWLYRVDHVRVRYDIEYEGVPIARLSPGTRGVVLLTLYLGLDQWDIRPLVIDQPEENLDPQSVFTTLVPFFKAAARRRQIIMVTHNANLVVNTDSDQVIVATAERLAPDQLPRLTYSAGGLEDPLVRTHICDLLEGGREAFRKRSERYGLSQ